MNYTLLTQAYQRHLYLTKRKHGYTDGSSFVEKGERKAGYTVVSLEVNRESGSLPPSTSAQKAELFALAIALELGEGERINVYMDSKYGFLILHAHAAIWKEKGMLSA